MVGSGNEDGHDWMRVLSGDQPGRVAAGTGPEAAAMSGGQGAGRGGCSSGSAACGADKACVHVSQGRIGS